MSNQATETSSADKQVKVTEFEKTVKSLAEKILASQKLQMVSSEEKCEVSLEHASIHAACMKLLGEKLKKSMVVYLLAFFNVDINAAVVYINDKPVLESEDSLCIWRATKAYMNRQEIAESFAYTLGCIFTAIGYDVFINNSTEPFTSVIKGKEIVSEKQSSEEK